MKGLANYEKKNSKSKVFGTHDPKDMLTAYKSIIIMF